MIILLLRHKKSRKDIHTRFDEQRSSRRPSRATRGATQYRESDGGSSSSSDDDDTKDYRVEHRKRKSTDRELDDNDSLDDEQEAPPVQHPP